MSKYRPYAVTFEDETGVIPFCIKSIGKEEKLNDFILLENCSINGEPAEIVFDTGSTTNIISESLAEKYNLIPVDIDSPFIINDTIHGKLAIAKELKLGNITITDVPFSIVNLLSNDSIGNQYVKNVDLFIGNPLILQLKDLTIDFVESQITGPSVAPSKSNIAPNMCYKGSGMYMYVKAKVNDNDLLMHLNTADGDYGELGYNFFQDNKEYITSTAALTEVNRALAGGVIHKDVYQLPNVILSLGGNTVTVPYINVSTTENPSYIDDSIGLKTLRLFSKIRLNFVDFVLTTFK